MLITCNGFKFVYNWFVHGVPFREAAECIFSTQAIALEDPKHSTSTEKRFNLISVSPKGRILLVGFCKRQKGYETRVISARPASRKERRQYAVQFGENVVYKAISHDTPKFRVRYIW